MKALILFFPSRLRELLSSKPRSSKEKIEQIDRLRAVIPISMLLGIASLGITAATLYRGLNHWTDYTIIFAFTGMAIQNGYAFIMARRILNEN